MPGLQADGVVAALGSPIKKSKLSLKFFQKKETKRALDFSETHAEEQNTQPLEAEEPACCDQVVPGPCPTSPLTCERRENLVPFVGLNNLGNTCYLNSILQVLYYCPGFKEAIRKLYKLSKCRDKQKEAMKNEQDGTEVEEQAPAQVELLGSFYTLITSVEQLQSNFLLSPDKYSEGELATPPRKLLNSLRQLNPMYEGYLQHDAQEVLQCILGYIQEACETICKEQQQSEPGEKEDEHSAEQRSSEEEVGAEGQLSGKRKSDTEAGNAKKKPKSQTKGQNAKEQEEEVEPASHPLTRSKRKSSGDITTEGVSEHPVKGTQEEGETEKEKEGGNDAEEGKSESSSKETGKRKKRPRLSWLKTSSGKQPSIFSKFRSMGRLSTHGGSRAESREDHGKEGTSACQDIPDNTTPISEQTKTQSENKCKPQSEVEVQGFDVLKRLFQGQLVLRTRCLECECFTERREDFQDISVPVQEDEPAPRETSSEISPEPKPELKTLKWAISQFASVERIVGEDKYFCETCHHYTEAERSLLFDKTPEVITIHLKCFSANSSEMDPYAGLSKVNTPLQTPLQLSLEEWSTGTAPRGQHYQLFAVVMHSGVTISSGHYTTYIRMSDLHNVSHREECAEEEEEKEAKQQQEEEEVKEQQPLKKEETAAQEYDDGEVSFSLSGRGASSAPAATAGSGAKAGGKKALEGVGLLGGQRSLATYDLGSSTKQQPANTDKSGFPSGLQPLSGGLKKEKDASLAEGEQGRRGDELALQNLLDYEGKWLLFDDSEVRLYEEEDFLRACSPETCSTSTPYLLFYRRVEAHK
ncbi:ubiquitin carboxyl-terminal hydrolase 1 isoform X1 [Alosa sapidissima]|uniref:ubiquitin carboxyl-terminal hydrolase 1 isoform X1 n=1 Tax=Alosa sapidissima TaxID=34773 RepID=UPI001C09B7FE|nr:ubiquitin carboxyl-terminal hydrolase 1 isoform X1 [Alosa sapidissima]XP_041913959.1 ubiquitin carboxyl-terminal hydrolase 1 isoform X1 [Alosa sapidissima]XP_041913960.1 ubiquitin carboxyl-terminal hydrolase 1 isoform X1 [Alosa sapidissima]